MCDLPVTVVFLNSVTVVSYLHGEVSEHCGLLALLLREAGTRIMVKQAWPAEAAHLSR